MLDFEWILTVFGLVIIVSLSKLFEPVRMFAAKMSPFLGALLGCPMCFGFWAGGILNLLGYSHYGNFEGLSLLYDALLGSSVSYILHCVTWRLITVKESPF